MTTVYVYVMNTMADWEIGYCLAELHSKRFFRKDAREISVKTVSFSKEPVISMGGLAIVPDLTIKDVQVNKDNVLILPGSDSWSESENFRILEIAKRFLEVGGLVTAICGATVALANIGILDNKKHTSNGAGFLNMFCPEYKGIDHYIDKSAVMREYQGLEPLNTSEFMKLMREKRELVELDSKLVMEDVYKRQLLQYR